MSRKARWGPWVAAIVFALAFLAGSASVIALSREHEKTAARICSVTVENRMSQRLTWETVRGYFIGNIPMNDPPESRREAIASINALVDAVLQPIPPLECVNNQPVPKEG